MLSRLCKIRDAGCMDRYIAWVWRMGQEVAFDAQGGEVLYALKELPWKEIWSSGFLRICIESSLMFNFGQGIYIIFSRAITLHISMENIIPG